MYMYICVCHLQVLRCVYMYVHMCVYVDTVCMYTCVYVCVHMCMCTYMSMCVCVCVYTVCVHVYMCVCVYVHMCVCTCECATVFGLTLSCLLAALPGRAGAPASCALGRLTCDRPPHKKPPKSHQRRLLFENKAEASGCLATQPR